MSKFTTQHYKAVAEVLRSNYTTTASADLVTTHPKIPNPYRMMQATVEDIALDFATMFKEDNPLFAPLKFLDACSPDKDRYPFSELWEE